MKKLILIISIFLATSLHAEFNIADNNTKINRLDTKILFGNNNIDIATLNKVEMMETEGASWFWRLLRRAHDMHFYDYPHIEEPGIHWNSPWIAKIKF